MQPSSNAIKDVGSSIQQAQQISFERQNQFLAKNKFAYSSETPTIQFKFTAPGVTSNSTASQSQQTTSNTQQTVATQPANFIATLSNGWTAYFDTTHKLPYFTHATAATTWDCPAECQSEFDPQLATFMATLSGQVSPQQQQPQPQAVDEKVIPPTPSLNTASSTTDLIARLTPAGSQHQPRVQFPTAAPVALTPSNSSYQPGIVSTASSNGNTVPPPLPIHLRNASIGGSTNRSGGNSVVNVEPHSNNNNNNGGRSNFVGDDTISRVGTVASLGTVADVGSSTPQSSFLVREHVANPPTSTLPTLANKPSAGPPPFPGNVAIGNNNNNNNNNNGIQPPSITSRLPPAPINATKLEIFDNIAESPQNTPHHSTLGQHHPPPFTPANRVVGVPPIPSGAMTSRPIAPTPAAVAIVANVTSHQHQQQHQNQQLQLQQQRGFNFDLLQDPNIKFAELFKSDPLRTQKDGVFLKLTTNFLKTVWKPRSVILSNGCIRYYDDVAPGKTNQPNAILTVSHCSVVLPPIGSGVHPKNGMFIDAIVGESKDVITRVDDINEFERREFFVRTDQPQQIDSWMHVLYRNGIIDARYCLNPDLLADHTTTRRETHRLYQIWTKEQPEAPPHHNSYLAGTLPTLQMSASGALSPSHFITPQHATTGSQTFTFGNNNNTSSNNNNTNTNVNTSNNNTNNNNNINNSIESIAGTPAINNDSNNNNNNNNTQVKGVYSHQPAPIPVNVNGNKTKVYYGVLFADRFELYATYNDASLLIKYSNPDTNNAINPEQHQNKPRIEYCISLTRDTIIEIQKSNVNNWYNEHSIKISTPICKFRGIKKQEYIITFNDCNPVTGHLQQVINPAKPPDSNIGTETIAGSSLANAIKYFLVMDYCITGPLSGVFGADLFWSVMRSPYPLPILHTCARVIAKGLDEVGIFRLSGHMDDISRLRRLFDGCINDAPGNNPHTCTGLFKLWLRENKDGIIPNNMYKQFTSLNCRAVGAGAQVEKRVKVVEELKDLVAQIPVLNQVVLSYVIYVATRAAAYESINKMGSKNLAMVLNGNLFEPPRNTHPQFLYTNQKQELFANPQHMAEALAEQESVVLIMIEHYEEIFTRGTPFTI